MNQRIEDFFKYCDGSGFANVYSTNFYIQRPDKIKALAKIQEIDIGRFLNFFGLIFIDK